MAASSRPRPPVLRALGSADPPLTVTVGGSRYARYEILKHDSWAATAVYAGPGGRIVCKFNRIQPVFGLDTVWLGRRLAARERRALERLADLPNVPNSLGEVVVDGQVWPNAVARRYVSGHPLRCGERVRPDFFPTLRELLAEMHRRGIAYVDLHKRENIIVGDDGRPYLIDFQIGFDATHPRIAGLLGVPQLFEVLCQSDLYHLQKHIAHHTPEAAPVVDRPWWIQAHRMIAVPFRQLRRRLLVAAKVRTGAGHVTTEQFAEDAVRNASRRAA
jgi:hypothetical protein